MVQYQATEHDWVLLAAVWTPQSEPAQPEIETDAASSINGKPGLTLDSSGQKTIQVRKWRESDFEKWNNHTLIHHPLTNIHEHTHTKKINTKNTLAQSTALQWSFCSEWNSTTRLWVQVVTWPPSPWRLNEERFRRERLLIYRSLGSNGWLVLIQGRGMIHAHTGPGRETPSSPLWTAIVNGNKALKQQKLWQDWHLGEREERWNKVWVYSQIKQRKHNSSRIRAADGG